MWPFVIILLILFVHSAVLVPSPVGALTACGEINAGAKHYEPHLESTGPHPFHFDAAPRR